MFGALWTKCRMGNMRISISVLLRAACQRHSWPAGSLRRTLSRFLLASYKATRILCWSVYSSLASLTEKVQRYGGALELRQIRVGFLLALLLFAVGCSSTLSHSGLAEPSVRLVDLEDIGELENRFNQDVGLPRLILILSPT